MTYCECGRRALAVVRRGKRRRGRGARPHAIRHHALCKECWEKMSDARRGKK